MELVLSSTWHTLELLMLVIVEYIVMDIGLSTHFLIGLFKLLS